MIFAKLYNFKKKTTVLNTKKSIVYGSLLFFNFITTNCRVKKKKAYTNH